MKTGNFSQLLETMYLQAFHNYGGNDETENFRPSSAVLYKFSAYRQRSYSSHLVSQNFRTIGVDYWQEETNYVNYAHPQPQFNQWTLQLI